MINVRSNRSHTIAYCNYKISKSHICTSIHLNGEIHCYCSIDIGAGKKWGRHILLVSLKRLLMGFFQSCCCRFSPYLLPFFCVTMIAIHPRVSHLYYNDTRRLEASDKNASMGNSPESFIIYMFPFRYSLFGMERERTLI